MYTLGTSAIKYVQASLRGVDPADPVASALDGRICAFVGTRVERDGTPPVQKSGYIAFFEEIGQAPAAGVPAHNCYVWVCRKTEGSNEWNWYNVGNAIVPAETIRAASSIINAANAFQRGPANRRGFARALPGVPYYATDTHILYVYDGIDWVPIDSGSGGASTPIGSMVVFAEGTATPIPAGWLRCNGSEVLRSEYAALYAVCLDVFGTAQQAGHFVLPQQDNFIIKALW